MSYGTVQAEPDMIAGYERVFGVAPSRGEVRFALAVARFESGYGEGWAKTQPGCADSLNLGAIHAGSLKPPCPEGTCPGFDTDEHGERYEQCFRSYATRAEAWEHFLRVLYVGGSGRFDRRPVRAAAASGDFPLAVERMRESGYFGLALDAYQARIRENDAAIAARLGEAPMYVETGAPGARGTGLGALAPVAGLIVIMGGIALAAR